MKSLAAPLLRHARALLPAAALLAVLGGTTAAAAPAQAGPAPARAHGAPAAAATLTWHSLTLVNGWQSASAPKLVTGKPAWAVQNGVVYLRGAVKQTTSGGSATFATMPAAERPKHNLYIQIYTNADVPGILYVGSNGAMEAYDGNADTFASLSAVSYPAAVKSHDLALKNGWVSSQPNFETGNPAYAVSKGVVYLSGSMHTTGTMTLAFVLPKAARPGHDLYISVYTFDGSTGFLEILPSGQVYVQGAQSSEFTSLAAVSFPVASTTWHDFKLEAGWKSDAKTYSTGSPAYAVINGVVYLNGSMDQPTSGTGLWTDLPAAARTKADVLEIEVYTVDGTTGSIAITNSLGLVSSMPFTDAENFTSLAGVAYPQKS